jgi:hypothetical protein
METATDTRELRKAVRMALPHLRTFRDGLVDAYARKPGDATSISKREKTVIADVASLDKAIRTAEQALMSPTRSGRAATQRPVNKPRTTNRKEQQ